MYKAILSTIAIGITFVAFVPYIRSIWHGQTKPHVFSWIIWGLTTVIVFFAQLAGNAGIGALPIGISGTITLYIAFLSYQYRADDTITQIDWVFFILALSSLPCWYFASDPLWAVVILSTTDLLGFAPTFRKAYVAPFEEQLTIFVLMLFRNSLVIAALEHYSMTTVLFPAVVGIACGCFIVMVLVRRSILNHAHNPQDRA